MKTPDATARSVFLTEVADVVLGVFLAVRALA
jgi:hypothetical protein